jgi:hypothetical protein
MSPLWGFGFFIHCFPRVCTLGYGNVVPMGLWLFYPLFSQGLHPGLWNVAPMGLWLLSIVFPGFAPWAMKCRPYGALAFGKYENPTSITFSSSPFSSPFPPLPPFLPLSLL